MTFFYDLNKKLDSIRAKPETTHKQLNERDMSRAAKGYEKYGKEGMEALAKAGREGKALDPIRAKYDKYDNKDKEQGVAEGMDEGILDKVKNFGKEVARVGRIIMPPSSSPGGSTSGHTWGKGQVTPGGPLGPIARYQNYQNRNQNEGMDEELGSIVKKIGGGMKKAAGRAMDTIAPGDEALLKDLQKKVGVPQTGKPPMASSNKVKEAGALMSAKQKSFAALAEPKDKITFADKIAGAKKEVDEVLGDVAANAMKKAISGHGTTKDKSRKEGWDDMMKDVERRRSEVKPGHKVAGAKGDIEKTATGIRHTRRYDPKTGETDTGDETGADGQLAKRGRGRPKGSTGKIGAKGPSGKSKLLAREQQVDEISSDLASRAARRAEKIGQAHADDNLSSGPAIGHEYMQQAKRLQRGADKRRERERDQEVQAALSPAKRRRMQAEDYDKDEYDREGDMALDDIDTIESAANELQAIIDANENLPEWVQSKINKAMDYLDTARDYMKAQGNDAEPVAEKAVSKKQQRFMGMVHAAQKGEKAPSKAVAKVAKTMKKGDAEDFAKTKHKGLPEKKKKEEVEETTVAGNVAPGAAEAPKSKGKSGMTFGKGIYDSMNRELEAMIAESMNVSMNMSNDAHGGPTKSLTVTATDDDAEMLGKLLKMAGMGSGEQAAGSCGSPAEQVDENQPDWPTDTETSNDALQYAGGLNKPKTTVAGNGQTTVPVTAVQVREQEQVMAPENDDLQRIKEMAGIREAAKPDYIDLDKDGNQKESMKKAADDKAKDKKVDESIFALTNQWKAYKG